MATTTNQIPVLHVLVSRQRETLCTVDTVVPLELGRQRDDEPEAYRQYPLVPAGARIVIAERNEKSALSRRHVRIDPAGDAWIVSNVSAAVDVMINARDVLKPGKNREVATPFTLALGDRTIHVERANANAHSPEQFESTDKQPIILLEEEEDDTEEDAEISSLGRKPPMLQETAPTPVPLNQLIGKTADGELLLHWLQSSMAVFQSAASSPDFLSKACGAMLDMVGLDTAAVMRWVSGRWHLDTLRTRNPRVNAHNWQPSYRMLEKVRKEKCTFRKIPLMSVSASLKEVENLVVAPILAPNGEVIGALYGDRKGNPENSATDVSPLEAKLVELLACGVAAGLARLDQEFAAVQARVQFEQFFTPELARQLETERNLLDGKDAEISVLFSDIRGFSRIAERLGAARTVAWVADVMEALSECVMRHSGVLVDYVGDELIAMWGAPVEEADHARLACRAALDMLRCMTPLNKKWESEIREPTHFGIGINTGIARVGNTGSRRKFKYGPLGNTVNLASRVQGATKYIHAQLLITEHTAALLPKNEFALRRHGRVRVVNIEEPCGLYEISADASENWQSMCQQYEAALAAFERGEFLAATKMLGNLVADHPEDGPSQLLLSRAVGALIDPSRFDPVWSMSGK
ncbi:MAG: adenylate/guanylate cyclase domain-containing protein [Pirellulaceae bacterium]